MGEQSRLSTWPDVKVLTETADCYCVLSAGFTLAATRLFYEIRE
jgi:hypothetical protein